MRFSSRHSGILAGLVLGLMCKAALAFKLDPVDPWQDQESFAERIRQAGVDLTEELVRFGVDLFTDRVHETLTHQSFGCEPSNSRSGCKDASLQEGGAPTAVIAGVRWNDNPPFTLKPNGTSFKECQRHRDPKTGQYPTIQLPNFSACWYKLFAHAGSFARRGDPIDETTNGGEVALIYRVHFGDMQFLHGMASAPYLEPSSTVADILAWAEFTYKVANNEGVDLGSRIVDVAATSPTMQPLVRVFSKKDWTVRSLFALGALDKRTDTEVRLMALGSLLHMMQDSFAQWHTHRAAPGGSQCDGAPQLPAPGAIEAFLAYEHQPSDKHGEGDGRSRMSDGLATRPNVIDVGKALVHGYYQAGVPWNAAAGNPSASAYLRCVFKLSPNAQRSRSSPVIEDKF